MKNTNEVYDIITDLMLDLSSEYEDKCNADIPLFSISEKLTVRLLTATELKERLHK